MTLKRGKIKWGIIGPGKIADKFAFDLQHSKNAVIHAVASRDIEKAKRFSHKYNTARYYDSYEALAKDPEINIVYVATPHAFHFENTMLCLRNAKAVLCEKPLGTSTQEVKRMFEEATSRNLFLMEGLWTRFIPVTEKLLALLNTNAIGDIQFIRADFGFKADFNPEGRLFNKKLGGGSLLDIGIYPIFLSLLVLGLPTHIKAMARMSPTGTDNYCAMLFDYENAAKAVLESTLESDPPTEAHIYGSRGMIKIHRRFHESQKISWYQNRALKETFVLKYEGYGFSYEIEEVNQCLINKKLESEKLPHGLSLALIHLIETVQEKIRLPGDKQSPLPS